MELTNSVALRARADKVIPYSSPYSHDASYYGGADPSAYPQFLSGGKGSHVWDVDGNEYIDWCASLGPCLFGYAYEPVDDAVIETIREGMTYSLPHYLEVEVAEKLAAFCPIDNAQVRFTKTGSDACAAAVRIARAATGRDRIISVGFHGGSDLFVAATPPAHGVPKALRDTIRQIEWSKLPDAFPLDKTIAAVIVEHGLEDVEPDFYHRLLKHCRRNGSLFILDEVVTGFRWPKGSVAHFYGIQPDIITYGKALANGYPLAAIVGRRDVMAGLWRDDPIFISTTFAGEPTALAAANVVLDSLDYLAVRGHIEVVGRTLMREMNAHGRGLFTLIGHPWRHLLSFPCGDGYPYVDDRQAWLARGLFIQEMARHGILINRPTFPSLAHDDDDIDRTVVAAQDAARTIWKALEAGTLSDMMAERRPRKLFEGR